MIDIKDILNKIEIDEFGRPNGIIAVNKPAGVTSHDIVDLVRKKLKTRRVGHAGALDPFATGVLLILVGKFTKLSEKLILEDKEYKARILFGISTDTQDPEGKITKIQEVKLDNKKITAALKSFEGGYEQYVPVFSSVKVDGNKLRKLARSAESFEITNHENSKNVTFKMPGKDVEVEIPRKSVEITGITISETGRLNSNDLPFKIDKVQKFPYAEVVMKVSKGTYIRQFAEDVGEKLGIPSMLLSLVRTKVGQVDIKDSIAVEDLSLDEV